ncbi:glycoside hydrolase family 3 protein [Tessaracoccus defluvii]|uniref:beta-glucosidase n=1 Tax=Tessaracoccus defluvii TaxID=1285901 RepID=A0A7H0H4H3_9ACTN|nr:glycoside hydrolase family 3 N-terminal domain-containing protein [Tessaracoccus defluvii]QNP55439.1 glycoside hydrolase family 3 protein [Tessaracoccus defluvii]
MAPVIAVSDDGTLYRDLNRNGVMDPYEDPRLTPEERVEDLVGRLSLAEKVGLMFHTVIEMDQDGDLLERPGNISKSPTSHVVLSKLMNHFNVHGITDGATAARWVNRLQRLAEQTPHGIPITISSDPRHAFAENVGVGFSGGPFSQWPDSLGLAAIDDPATTEAFADIVRQEYVAVGIRAALHPQVDLATDPRWCRQLQTFGAEAGRSAAHTAAYLTGLQGPVPGAGSVACTTKHFPGGGPQKDGEEAHFPYGKQLVYPAGRFEEHLEPFRTAIAHGTAGIMPGYGIPVGLVLDGHPVEEVGIGFNRQLLQGLLRQAMGFDGVILTDWELINDNHVGDQVLPARAWGVEGLQPSERLLKLLSAGVDQVGGEECVETLLGLVTGGLVPESRLDESVRRILLVKFRLGLFDNPYVGEEAAATVPGCDAHREAGRVAQSRSVVVLENHEVRGRQALPLAPGARVYLEGVDPATPGLPGPVVATPEEADVAIVRIGAPFDPRDDLFLESFFHQGSLEFRPGLIHRLRTIAAAAPLIVDVALDRAAVLTPLSDIATALTVTFGVSDGSLIDALTGTVPPIGRLPVAIPVSMDAVRAVDSDAGLQPAACLYPIGTGLGTGVRTAP